MTKKLRHVEEISDAKTGELKIVSKTFAVKAESSEEFFFTFLGALNVICELSRPTDLKLLSILCTMCEYNTGKVSLTPTKRTDICQKLGVSSQAVSNSISRLKESKLLLGSRGDYEVNPQYFWKGTTNERQKLLKNRSMDLMLKFSRDGVQG